MQLVIDRGLRQSTSHRAIGLIVIVPLVLVPRKIVRDDVSVTIVTPESMRTKTGTLMEIKSHGHEMLLPTHLASDRHIVVGEITRKIEIGTGTGTEAATAHIASAIEVGSQRITTKAARNDRHHLKLAFMVLVGSTE